MGAALEQAKALFTEYVRSLAFSLDYQDIDAELATLPGKYAPPQGCIFIAVVDGQPMGCIALRPIAGMPHDLVQGRPARVCEMKRMYVRPAARGLGLGRLLASAIIEFATAAGYDQMKLDTESDFTAAVSLYRSLGFTDCPRYNNDPQPNTLWMARPLGTGFGAPATIPFVSKMTTVQTIPSPAATLQSEPAFASEILRGEGDALLALASRVAGPMAKQFTQAVDLICNCADTGGNVLVSGLGKSGLVGSKISATLSSLGIPSHPVHPAEAAHGDLGRFRSTDTVICISASGQTQEVVDLASILKQDGLPIIAIVNADSADASALARLASVTLTLGIAHEAGHPHFVAPTSTTTATMAMGDALALAAARRRCFTDADFARRHPGGSLGGLLRPVTDVLRFEVGKNLPLIPDTATVREALRIAAQVGRRPGAIVLIDSATGKLSGIFTDADVRRLILREPSELDHPISGVMTRSPRTLPSSAIVRDAVLLVRETRADEIPVIDEAGRPVGVLDVQDLFTMRLVRD
jgi:arabinose-5-phosphate isomerase